LTKSLPAKTNPLILKKKDFESINPLLSYPMKYLIYFDYNATTPCDEEVIEAMLPWFGTHFGNAASKNHAYGWMAEDAVETARSKVAELIGAKSKEIIFTSGATEAINLGIKGISDHYQGEKQHFITCKTEHKATLDTFQSLEKNGSEVSYLDVNEFGQLDMEQLRSAILPHTKMIALMWANNEIGNIFPMEEIKQLAKEKDLILFTDAVQAAGKIPVGVLDLHLMAISAHKLYGPKGIGALFIRHNHHLPKPIGQILGGGHEKGYRSGTLNVPAIVGFGKAAEIRLKVMERENVRLKSLRNLLEISLLDLPGTKLNGDQENRLAHVANIAFEGVEGEEFLRMMNKEIAVSSGSACSTISPKPSHVLNAMGLDGDLARSSIRFSLGMQTTENDILLAVEHVKKVLDTLR
jgi:cysteine desulfurase